MRHLIPLVEVGPVQGEFSLGRTHPTQHTSALETNSALNGKDDENVNSYKQIKNQGKGSKFLKKMLSIQPCTELMTLRCSILARQIFNVKLAAKLGTQVDTN